MVGAFEEDTNTWSCARCGNMFSSRDEAEECCDDIPL